MGQKINPIGLRLQVNRTWDSRWFADGAEYGKLLHEDLAIREFIKKNAAQAGISRVIIERPHKKCRVTIHAARPGVIIGKKGADIEVLRKKLAAFTKSELHLNIVEIRKPEIDAAVLRAIDSTQYVQGPEVAAFEKCFAPYCGVEHCLAVNTGTSALHLALLAAGIGAGDEVITVSLTFVATTAAIGSALNDRPFSPSDCSTPSEAGEGAPASLNVMITSSGWAAVAMSVSSFGSRRAASASYDKVPNASATAAVSERRIGDIGGDSLFG